MADVVSLGDRLRLRRTELGLSQAQAARELDVARTAYRLWEMEAAKPAPDRWRLISRWLGVSVSTMLLAEELISKEEATAADAVVDADFGTPGRGWDAASPAGQGDFFQQSRSLVDDGLAAGSITREQADELTAIFDRLEQERQAAATAAWAPGELRKAFPAGVNAPRAAREAVSFIAADIPTDALETARLLTSELVTNSVIHGPAAPASVGLVVDVQRARIRVAVSDEGDAAPQPMPPSQDGGYGLTLVEALATRWSTSREAGRNVVWFEIDLPVPGAQGPPVGARRHLRTPP